MLILFLFTESLMREHFVLVAVNDDVGLCRVTTLQTMWNSQTVCSTPVHVQSYSYHAGTSIIVSDGVRNTTVHDSKPKW